MHRAKISYIFLLLFVICHFSSIKAQIIFDDDYILVQYIAENYSYRSVIHNLLSSVDDTTGTYLELFRVQGEPDSGSFIYHSNSDQTFTIDDSLGMIYGHIDDTGDVFSLVNPDEDMGYFGIGIRKSSGKSLSNLTGQYWVARFESDEETYFELAALDMIEFNGSGNATLYPQYSSSGEFESFSFPYTIEDDGMLTFDDFLKGILSPDDQIWVAAISDSGYHTYLYGIKMGSGLDNSALSGTYNYTQYYAENNGWDDQAGFYGRLQFDGLGTGIVTMAMGEAASDTFNYSFFDDGFSNVDSLLVAVGSDNRYFLTLELMDMYSVSFGLGIEGVETAAAIKSGQGEPPHRFLLSQNYPNPFNPSTIIYYELRMTSDVDLSVYNLLGQKVATLISKNQSAGSYQVEWDATGFASGVYYYSLESGEFRAVRKMILVR